MNVYKYNKGDFVDPYHKFVFLDYGKGVYLVKEVSTGYVFEANRYLLRQGQIACAPQRRGEYRSNLYRKYHVGDILGHDKNIQMIDDDKKYGYITNKNGKKVRKYLWKNIDTGISFVATLSSVLSGSNSGIKTGSKGENKVEKTLDSLGVLYYKQYSFEDCTNPKTGRKLLFDFFLPDYNCCIEYDGRQHYKAKGSYAELEGIENIKYRDSIKNHYCANHDLTLIRIPYTEYNIIDCDKLLDFIEHGSEFNVYNCITAEVIKRFEEAGY